MSTGATKATTVVK